MSIKASELGMKSTRLETVPEIHRKWFVGKKLVNVTGTEPYIRYEFEGGGYFEHYQHLGELNWIKVEEGLPPNSPVGPETDMVLVHTNREYSPSITTATGEYTEDGFQWHLDNERVLEPVWGGLAKLQVTEWAPISYPINHKGKESE
jgi:hypothetical protein